MIDYTNNISEDIALWVLLLMQAYWARVQFTTH